MEILIFQVFNELIRFALFVASGMLSDFAFYRDMIGRDQHFDF